jgi:hypothetical protein
MKAKTFLSSLRGIVNQPRINTGDFKVGYFEKASFWDFWVILGGFRGFLGIFFISPAERSYSSPLFYWLKLNCPILGFYPS